MPGSGGQGVADEDVIAEPSSQKDKKPAAKRKGGKKAKKKKDGAVRARTQRIYPASASRNLLFSRTRFRLTPPASESPA
jgi:hypothetical protein